MILTEAIRLYCKAHKIGVRELAGVTGLNNHMTASRFLKGKSIDSYELSKILVWVLQNNANSSHL